MDLLINHHTKYIYSEPVFVEPHYLNFHPMLRQYIKLSAFSLAVMPEPSGIYPSISAQDTIQHQCWFNNLVKELIIDVSIQVQTRKFNPFEFFIDAQHPGTLVDQNYLQAYEPMNEQMWGFLEDCRGNGIMDVVNILLQKIQDGWEHEIRYADDILLPSDCFELKKGSCRDLSWMMINMLRNLQIASRFVSGYAFNDELGEGHELHAWVDFYAPGAGWIGVDTTAGMYCTEVYIPVSSSYDPKHTLPVIGKYRGNASSELHTEVTIRTLD